MTLKGHGRDGSNFQADLLNNASTVWHIFLTIKFGRITCGEERMNQPRPNRKGGGAPALPNLGFSSIYAYILWRKATKFDVATHPGRGLVLGVSLTSPQKRGPSAPQFWGFPSTSIYAYTLLRNSTKCDVATHVGRNLFLRGQSYPTQRGWVRTLPIFGVPAYRSVHPLSQNHQIWCGDIGRRLVLRVSHASIRRERGPNSPIFGVPFHLCIHPLMQNYKILRGNIYGKGTCFRGPPRPHIKGAGPMQRSPVWGSLLFMPLRTHFVAELPNLTCRGVACILQSAKHPIPTQRSSRIPQFCFFFSPVFTPTTFNAERPNSAW